MKIELKVVNHSGLPLPQYQTAQSAGADLRACIPDGAAVILPGERLLIPTGLFIEIPIGYEAQVRPRSGLALKHGITVLNAPGTIDADYRGELKVLLINLGTEPFSIIHGDRIAQLILAPVITATFVSVTELSKTSRDSGGYGSTGR